MELEDLDFHKGGGLIPVVVQENESKDVLMLAYVNKEALRKTLESGYAHYWSRSRDTLWKKGATSGNVQRIIKIQVDCDADAILYTVDQTGPACHTGKQTCFHNNID